jgi:hypothetical protein
MFLYLPLASRIPDPENVEEKIQHEANTNRVKVGIETIGLKVIKRNLKLDVFQMSTLLKKMMLSALKVTHFQH